MPHEIGIATNKKLIDIFNMMKDGTLIVAPSFQRNLVWNNNHKEAFIETILRGLPFPEVYFADGDIDLETKTSKTLVVDGQQRLTTVYQYVTGDKDLAFHTIGPFADLTAQQKTHFLDYKIVIRDLGRLEDDKIREIFQRINSVQYALNAIEIKNALYEGEFISTAKELSASKKYFRDVEIFTENEFARMKDIDFILLIMATVEEGGYFAFDNEVEKFVVRYNESYEGRKNMTCLFDQILTILADMNLPADSLWNRRSSFFTLFVELSRFISEKKALPRADELRDFLLQFEGNLYENKGKKPDENKYAAYYNYIYQSTGSKKGRITRGEVLREELMAALRPHE